MVLADNVRNGRRSRGPSPNGHAGGVTDSSSDDENSKKNGNTSTIKKKSEYEEKIRVGRDYQAVCPELIPAPERKPELLNDRALLVWSPTKEIPDMKLEDYITVAKDKYGYNGEQALGMLFWHKHDLERAVMDLANFTPFPDEWTVEDKVLFEQAFQFHGKSFHRIRQMLPDKSIASLVKFYYSWKKTRSRTSVMDRQEKIKSKDGSENGSEHGSNEDSDNEDKKWPIHRGIRRASGSPPRGITVDTNTSPAPTVQGQTGQGNTQTASTVTTNGGVPNETNDSKQTPAPSKPSISNNLPPSINNNAPSTAISCTGCGVTCTELNKIPQGKLCGSCYHHWRRTGVLRPTSGPIFMSKRTRGSTIIGKSGDSHKRKPPRGMYINHDDIVKLANSAQNTDVHSNDDLLAGMDREIVSLWSQIQTNKQMVSSLKRKNSDASDETRPSDNPSVRLNSRWNNEELLLAVQGVRKYGRDFQAIADALGTKTEAQVRTFFVNYRRRYNLDNVLKEYEAENSIPEQQQNTTSNDSNSNQNNGSAANNVVVGAGKTFKNALQQQQSDNDIMEIDLVEEENNMLNGNRKDSPEVAISQTASLQTIKASAVAESVESAMEVDENNTNLNTKITSEAFMIK